MDCFPGLSFDVILCDLNLLLEFLRAQIKHAQMFNSVYRDLVTTRSYVLYQAGVPLGDADEHEKRAANAMSFKQVEEF